MLRQKLPITEKESFRWITCANESKNVFPTKTIKTVIADRESDIFEEFCLVPDETTHLITRSSHNRRLTDGEYFFSRLDDSKVRGKSKVKLFAITGKRKAREAVLEIKFEELGIKKPERVLKGIAKSKTLMVIDVKEKKSLGLKEKDRIHWRLLTTHKVENLKDAIKILNWYKQRWQIEQLFRTMKKQGFGTEESQLKSCSALNKICILALVSSVEILKLTIARSGENKRSIKDVFEEDDKEILQILNKKYQGRTTKQKNPHKKNSLAWAAWIIARMGGWKGYASERPPGPITMFNGLEQYRLIKLGWAMAFEDVCIR